MKISNYWLSPRRSQSAADYQQCRSRYTSLQGEHAEERPVWVIIYAFVLSHVADFFDRQIDYQYLNRTSPLPGLKSSVLSIS